MRNVLKRRWWLIGILPLGALIAFLAWASFIPAPMPEALTAMISDEQVTVEQARWLVFRPVANTPATGLILYPGARVDPRAYAPIAHAIAAQGYLVVIVPMPLNLAVFAPIRAAEVIPSFPNIQHWAIGGHSLGGAMAAQYAEQYPEQVAGLVLWAAYPAQQSSLADRDLSVVSISGTQDGLATPADITGARALLPADTEWVAIEGGNHAQFGWYGTQAGDNPATITRGEQQAEVVKATLELLSRVNGRTQGTDQKPEIKALLAQPRLRFGIRTRNRYARANG